VPHELALVADAREHGLIEEGGMGFLAGHCGFLADLDLRGSLRPVDQYPFFERTSLSQWTLTSRSWAKRG
jgi:hypothetical protein